MDQVEGRPRVGLRWVLVGVVVLAIAAIVALLAFNDSHPESPEELLDAYISALNNDDRDAMVELIHRDVEATKEISEKLAKFGGQNIEVTDVDIKITGLGGDVAEVKVTGRGDGGPYAESLHFSGDEFGDWYLDLGHVKVP